MRRRYASGSVDTWRRHLAIERGSRNRPALDLNVLLCLEHLPPSAVFFLSCEFSQFCLRESGAVCGAGSAAGPTPDVGRMSADVGGLSAGCRREDGVRGSHAAIDASPEDGGCRQPTSGAGRLRTQAARP